MEYKLLRHPSPYRHESVMSYLYRLAEENYYTFNEIKKLFKISYTLTYERFNKDISDRSIKLIANATNKDQETIYKMTLKRFDFWKMENENSHKYSYFRDTILTKHLKYCPCCLNENNYERIHWKLEPIKVCLDHKVFLIESCNNCGEELPKDWYVKGKCKCGFKLTDATPQICFNDLIIEGQKKMYKALGLYNEETKKNDIFYYKLITKEYIEIINYFNSLVISNIEVFDSLQFFLDEKNNNIKVKTLIYVEWILCNWPASIYYVLDKLNSDEYLDYQYTEYRKKYDDIGIYADEFWDFYRAYKDEKNAVLLNPLDRLDFSFNLKELIINNNFIKNALVEYFINNFTVCYFEKRLNKSLVLNKFIEVSEAISIFFNYDAGIKEEYCISYNGITSVFNTYNFDNKKYFVLSEIIDFFKSVVIKENILNEKNDLNKYKDIDYFLNKFKSFDIKPEDIINLIKNNKVKVKFDCLFRYGIGMIYLNKKETTRQLLLLLIKNLDD